ncbi:MAG: HlyD family secretion protein [Pseudomonadota bacterium]|nr:HlyD family secretion protein [Afipia sp.]
MADPVVKFPAEQKLTDTPLPSTESPRKSWGQLAREKRRTLLLVVVPAIALLGGIAFYLSGGRYATTDDAYVGAQKVLITPDISGKIEKVLIKEGQKVKAGDELFEIDPVPFRFALQQAKATLETARTNYDNLRSNVSSYTQLLELARQGVDLKQRDVDRKSSLVKSQSGSQLDLDTSATNLVLARAQLELLQQQLANAKNQLLGNPDLPLEEFPPYFQAKAALDQAQRNLDHTVLRAPIDGTATQVDSIQLGRFVAAGSPVFSVIDNANPWVDANLKESDLTYVGVGQPVTMSIDAFPDHTFMGKVGSLSPGTGAQFAILPPQNSTGNFVKVVQRVPVRIYFDKNDQAVQKLKAGMSTYVWVDTGHKRSLAGLLGFSSASAQEKTR